MTRDEARESLKYDFGLTTVDMIFEYFEQVIAEKDEVIADLLRGIKPELHIESDRERIKELEAELGGFKKSLEWDEYVDHCKCKNELEQYENPVAEFSGEVEGDRDERILYIDNGSNFQLECWDSSIEFGKNYRVIVLEVKDE